jgi:hypothetical protein
MKIRTHQPQRGCITLAGSGYNPVGVAIVFGGRVPKIGGLAANLGLNDSNAIGVFRRFFGGVLLFLMDELESGLEGVLPECI